MRSLLAASMSILLLAGLGGSMRQADAAPAAVAPPEQESTELEEIVVTAQKRAENLQKVPLSITVVSANDLKEAGVTGFAGLQNIVPSLEFGESTANGSMEVALRGVAPLPDFPGQDPVVAFHVDGVYNSRPAAANGLFFDVQRVEVLRGPQGTLYGRNSTAGAINVITNRPTDDLEANVEVGAGNYGLLRSSGMLNLPIVNDELAIRFAFQQEKHQGYINTGQPTENEDARDFAGRAHLLFTPTENFSLRLSGDSFHKTGEGGMEVPLCNFKTSNPWRIIDGFDTTKYPACVPTPGQAYYSNYGTPIIPSDDSKNYGGSAELNWTSRPFTITDIVARRIVSFEKISKIAGEYSHTIENSGEVTNELRFSSNPGAKLTWVVGQFYFHEHQSADTGQGDPVGYLFGYNWLFGAPADPTNPVAFPYGPGAIEHLVDRDAQTKSWAEFEQATYPFLDWLRVTEGLRYTSEKKTAYGSIYLTDPIGDLLTPQNPFAALAVSHATNWKLSVDMDVAANSLLYANAGTGYKSGGFSEVPQNSGNPNSYAPQTVTSFEIGAKNRFMDNRLQVNAAIFLDRYKDYQTYEAVPLFGNDGYVFFGYPTINAATAKIYGFENEDTFLLTDDDRFDLAVNYLHARYGTAVVQGVDVSGTPLGDSPAWTLNFGYQHIWRLGNERTFSAALKTHYRGVANMQQEPDNELNFQRAYTNTSIVLTYDAPKQGWYANAWIKNLEDKAVISLATSQDNGSIAPPRTFGINVGKHFH